MTELMSTLLDLLVGIVTGALDLMATFPARVQERPLLFVACVLGTVATALMGARVWKDYR